MSSGEQDTPIWMCSMTLGLIEMLISIVWVILPKFPYDHTSWVTVGGGNGEEDSSKVVDMFVGRGRNEYQWWVLIHGGSSRDMISMIPSSTRKVSTKGSDDFKVPSEGDWEYISIEVLVIWESEDAEFEVETIST